MQRLSKNFIWMAAANIATSIFAAAAFIYLARVLEPEAFGYLSYASSFIFFAANFVDLGLATYGLREVAKDTQRASEYVSDIISFKLVVASLLYILFLAGVLFSCHSAAVKLLMAECGLMLFSSAMASEWAMQGKENMYIVFVSFSFTALLQLIFMLAFIKSPEDLLKVPLLYFLATLPAIILLLKLLNFRAKIRGFDLARIKKYLSSSLVFWSISICAQVYNGLDIAILAIFRKAQEVGYFSVARRAVGGIALLLLFLANGALPRLTSTFRYEMSQFAGAIKKFLRLSFIMTLFVFLPGIFLSERFILVAFGPEYLPAAVPLKIMITGLMLVIFNLPYSTALVAAGLEKSILKQTVASAALSVIMNFILMPRYGMIGAAVSFMSAETLALILILRTYNTKIAVELVKKERG